MARRARSAISDCLVTIGKAWSSEILSQLKAAAAYYGDQNMVCLGSVSYLLLHTRPIGLLVPTGLLIAIHTACRQLVLRQCAGRFLAKKSRTLFMIKYVFLLYFLPYFII